MFNQKELTLIYAALDDYIRTTDELFSDGEISEQEKESKDVQARDLKKKVLSMI